MSAISRWCVVLLSFGALVAAPPLVSQQESATFVVRLGNDTIAVEHYTRTSNRIEGEVFSRVPTTSRLAYTATLHGDYQISSFTLTRYLAPASDSVIQRISMEFGADSVITTTVAAGRTQRRAVAASPAALPYVGNSFAMHELAAQRAQHQRRDSLAVPIVPPGAAESWTLVVRRGAGDSLTTSIVLPGGEISHEGRRDQRMRLLALRGTGGSYGSHVERAPDADVKALAADFARRDREGRGLGQLSPRDTARATIAGAAIEIDYSRPSARGRTVVGGLIHEGSIWRMGANQATHLRTDRDLAFGDVVVPAGTYTLYAIAGRDAWTLVINRQTGQWGTEYDPAQDLARLRMQTTRSRTPREQFTIEAVEHQGGGVLRVLWDDVVASTPFTVR
jgi:hypothetical protein